MILSLFLSGFPAFPPLVETEAVPSSLVTTAAESSAEPDAAEDPVSNIAAKAMRATFLVIDLITNLLYGLEK
jgi:hypothetical protein